MGVKFFRRLLDVQIFAKEFLCKGSFHLEYFFSLQFCAEYKLMCSFAKCSLDFVHSLYHFCPLSL